MASKQTRDVEIFNVGPGTTDRDPLIVDLDVDDQRPPHYGATPPNSQPLTKKQRYWWQISPLHKFFTAFFAFIAVSVLAYGILRITSIGSNFLAEKIAVDVLLGGLILVGLVANIVLLKFKKKMPKDTIATVVLSTLIFIAAAVVLISSYIGKGNFPFGINIYEWLANITAGFPFFELLIIAGSVATAFTLLAHGLHNLNPKNIFSTVNGKAAAVIVTTVLTMGGVGAILLGVFNAALGWKIAAFSWEIGGASFTIAGGWLTTVGIGAVGVGVFAGIALIVMIMKMPPIRPDEEGNDYDRGRESPVEDDRRTQPQSGKEEENDYDRRDNPEGDRPRRRSGGAFAAPDDTFQDAMSGVPSRRAPALPPHQAAPVAKLDSKQLPTAAAAKRPTSQHPSAAAAAATTAHNQRGGSRKQTSRSDSGDKRSASSDRTADRSSVASVPDNNLVAPLSSPTSSTAAPIFAAAPTAPAPAAPAAAAKQQAKQPLAALAPAPVAPVAPATSGSAAPAASAQAPEDAASGTPVNFASAAPASAKKPVAKSPPPQQPPSLAAAPAAPALAAPLAAAAKNPTARSLEEALNNTVATTDADAPASAGSVAPAPATPAAAKKPLRHPSQESPETAALFQQLGATFTVTGGTPKPSSMRRSAAATAVASPLAKKIPPPSPSRQPRAGADAAGASPIPRPVSMIGSADDDSPYEQYTLLRFCSEDRIPVETVKSLLKSGSADVNLRDKEGVTPLHWACARGDVAVVKLLVEAGAKTRLQIKVNGIFPHRRTPIWVAREYYEGAQLEALLDALGASKAADISRDASRDASKAASPGGVGLFGGSAKVDSPETPSQLQTRSAAASGAGAR